MINGHHKTIGVEESVKISLRKLPTYETVGYCPCDGEDCDRDTNCEKCKFYIDIFELEEE